MVMVRGNLIGSANKLFNSKKEKETGRERVGRFKLNIQQYNDYAEYQLTLRSGTRLNSPRKLTTNIKPIIHVNPGFITSSARLPG